MESMDFIDRQISSHHPYFLYFAFTLPHTPTSGKALKKDPTNIPDTLARQSMSDGKLQRLRDMRKRMTSHIAQYTEASAKAANGNTHWMTKTDEVHNVPGLLWIDGIINEFITFLTSRGRFEKTFILFTADHGCLGKGHCNDPVSTSHPTQAPHASPCIPLHLC